MCNSLIWYRKTLGTSIQFQPILYDLHTLYFLDVRLGTDFEQ